LGEGRDDDDDDDDLGLQCAFCAQKGIVHDGDSWDDAMFFADAKKRREVELYEERLEHYRDLAANDDDFRDTVDLAEQTGGVIEGGTWEHRKRAKEMLKTAESALEVTLLNKGKHHIAQFLPEVSNMPLPFFIWTGWCSSAWYLTPLNVLIDARMSSRSSYRRRTRSHQGKKWNLRRTLRLKSSTLPTWVCRCLRKLDGRRGKGSARPNKA